MRFRDRSVLVTGAGSGIGRATALGYAAEGARVLAVDIDAEAAEGTVREIRSNGGAAAVFEADLAGRAAAHGAVEAAVAHFGRLDALANVAAIYPRLPLEEIDEKSLQRVLAVDLVGPLFACQAAVARMKAQGGGGSIVNVASGAAFHPFAGQAMYAAAKGGLVSMTRVLALEAAPHRIRFNTVVPGSTDTPGTRALPDAQPDTSEALPLGRRWLRPEQVAEVILWCSSDAAGMVNGALVRVDGGQRML